jgi:hypothetical protein
VTARSAHFDTKETSTMRSFIHILTILIATGSAQSLSATVTQYENKMQWQQAVANNFTTLDFTGFPKFTLLTTQYVNLGAIFDGTDDVETASAFINDGWGLEGNGDIFVNFTQPMYYIATDFPGFLQYKLYFQNQLIFTSSVFSQGFVGNFAGLISTTPFDRAQLIDPTGGAAIDDLFFGPPIPAPGVFGSLAAFALFNQRRRRA